MPIETPQHSFGNVSIFSACVDVPRRQHFAQGLSQPVFEVLPVLNDTAFSSMQMHPEET